MSDRNRDSRSSCCSEYWFHIAFTVLLLIILLTATALMYVLRKQAQKERERRRIQNEFKQKHGLANKVLDLISKDGIVARWFKKFQGSLVTMFRQMITEMVELIFEK